MFSGLKKISFVSDKIASAIAALIREGWPNQIRRTFVSSSSFKLGRCPQSPG